MTTKLPSVENVSALKVPHDSLLVLKLGSPDNGWLPSPEMEQEVKARFEAALKERGYAVTVVTVPYWVEIQMLHH